MTPPRPQQSFGQRGTKRAASAAIRRRREASPLEFYWPYFTGFGGAGAVYFLLLAFALGGALGVNPLIGAAFLFLGAPLLITGYLGTAFIVTKSLASFRSAAGAVHGINNFALASAGGRLGAGAGFILFCFQKEADITAIFTEHSETLASDLAFLTLAFLTYFGLGMIVGDLVGKKVFKQDASKDNPDSANAEIVSKTPPLPETISALLEKWPFYAAVGASAVAALFAVLGKAFSESATVTPLSVVIDVAFCMLAFFVLRFYFSITDNILRGAKWFYEKAADFA